MKIEVTAEDIESGVRRDKERCPIALALRRIFPRDMVEVTYSAIWVGLEKYSPSQQIRDFISNFDNYLHVAPFSFELR